MADRQVSQKQHKKVVPSSFRLLFSPEMSGEEKCGRLFPDYAFQPPQPWEKTFPCSAPIGAAQPQEQVQGTLQFLLWVSPVLLLNGVRWYGQMSPPHAPAVSLSLQGLHIPGWVQMPKGCSHCTDLSLGLSSCLGSEATGWVPTAQPRGCGVGTKVSRNFPSFWRATGTMHPWVGGGWMTYEMYLYILHCIKAIWRSGICQWSIE